MKRSRQTDYGWILAMAYVFLLPLGAAGLALCERFPLLLARLATEVSAAWAQAIFSVVAILTAILISRREANLARFTRQADEAEVCRLSILAIESLSLQLKEIGHILPTIANLPAHSIEYYCDHWEGVGARRTRAAELMLTRPFPTMAMEALLVVADAAQGTVEIAKEVRKNGAKASPRGRWVADMLVHLNDAKKTLNWIREDLGFSAAS